MSAKNKVVQTAAGPIPAWQKLTNKIIEDLPPPVNEKARYMVADTGFKYGTLYVRVSQTRKTFFLSVFVYSPVTQQRQTVKRKLPDCNPVYPALSVENARKRAKLVLNQLSDPSQPDPFNQAKEKKKEPTVLDVLREYLRYCETTDRIKARTAKDYSIMYCAAFKDYLDHGFSTILDRKVIHDLILEKGKKANQALRILSAVINYSRTKYTDSKGKPMYENTVADMKRGIALPNYAPRKVCLETRQDYQDYFAALDTLPAIQREYCLFILFTGYRGGLLYDQLTWGKIDWVNYTYSLIPKKRIEAEAMPLPRYIGEILRKRYNPAQPNTKVFPHFSTAVVRRMHDKIERQLGKRILVKDLRTGFATLAEALGIAPHIVSSLVSHTLDKNVHVTDRNYKNFEAVKLLRQEMGDHVDPLREALDKIEKTILMLADQPEPDNSNVTYLAEVK